MTDQITVIECRGGCVETLAEQRTGAGEVRRSSNYDQVAEGGYRMLDGSLRWSGRDITPKYENITVIEIDRGNTFTGDANDVQARYIGNIQRVDTDLWIMEKSIATDEYINGLRVATFVNRLVLNPEPVLTVQEQKDVIAAIEGYTSGTITQPIGITGLGSGTIVSLHGMRVDRALAKGDILHAVVVNGDTAYIQYAEALGWAALGVVDNVGDGRWHSHDYTFPGLGPCLFYVNGTMDAVAIIDNNAYVNITVPGVTDFPTHVVVHQNHLFLAFPNGRIIHSAIGDPQNFAAVSGAAELGVGGEITGFQVLPGDSLAIYCKDRIAVLSGTSTADWQMSTYSDEIGAYEGTIQNMPTSIFCDKRGVTTLSSSDRYANFASKTLSQKFDPLYQRTIGNAVLFSSINREKSQYRIYNETGHGIHMTFTAGALVGGMAVDLKHEITAVGSLRGDEDINYFASSDGWVHRMDWGSTMSGKPLEAFLEFPYFNYGSARQKKNFKELVFDIMGDPRVEISATNSVDRGEPYNEDGSPVDIQVREREKPGYLTNILTRFRQRIRGVAYTVGTGFDQSILIRGGAHRHIINSMTVHYTYRGQKK